MALEEAFRRSMQPWAEGWSQSENPADVALALSIKAENSPSEAPKYFKTEKPLEEGIHSYLLTLQHGEDGKPFVLLSVEDFRTQDVGEQSYILIERAIRRAEEKWGENVKLLRVGELRIRPNDVMESGISNIREGDIAMMDAIRTSLPNIPQESIGIQWDR